MIKQKNLSAERRLRKEGEKKYVTWVPDLLVPNSIPSKVQLYFSAVDVHDISCCIFLTGPPPPFKN